MGRPEYTEEARAASIEGKVRVEITVDASGAIRSVKVLEGLGHGLDEAAVRAVEGATFEPAQQCWQGRGIDIRGEHPIYAMSLSSFHPKRVRAGRGTRAKLQLWSLGAGVVGTMPAARHRACRRSPRRARQDLPRRTQAHASRRHSPSSWKRPIRRSIPSRPLTWPSRDRHPDRRARQGRRGHGQRVRWRHVRCRRARGRACLRVFACGDRREARPRSASMYRYVFTLREEKVVPTTGVLTGTVLDADTKKPLCPTSTWSCRAA